ncbi:tRNA (adenosine(37)-N6)-dimethylallyltransferase MiaA [bacterium]|nr:MAG: tRNA (adenosine(37)-N6)-dimethylallyltransferase MiaA [bacterium]
MSLKTRRILAIVGPTASGKTPLSLLVAEILNGEIVSADSRQIFKYLDIGTAKPTRAERKRVPHHFVDFLDPKQEYSAGLFGDAVKKVVKDVFDRGKVPILVGGSGLYIKSAIDGLFGGPGRDPEIRARLEDQLRTGGLEPLLDTLGKFDPIVLQRMKEITPRRVIRALEVFFIAGKPLSEYHSEQEKIPDYQAIQFGLEWERKELYSRINHRVDRMISDGLMDEVQKLAGMGYDRHLNALNTVGYKEVFDYLEGTVNAETMIDLIKRNTRRFAKRQITWFKADKRIRHIPMTETLNLEAAARRITDEYRKEMAR